MRIQQVLNKQSKPPLNPLLRKEGKWGGQIFINLPLLIENLLYSHSIPDIINRVFYHLN